MEQTEKVRTAFLRDRRKGIGGSDVAAIFGLDRYRTPEDVWLEKTGQVIPIDEPSGDKERGTRLEPVAAELYAAKTGKSLLRTHTPLVHPEYPWMRGNVDRLVLPPDRLDTGNQENEIAEIKCPSLGMYSKIKREGLPYAWLLQMQHYLCTSGLQRGVWIIFCADRWELIDFPVERDELVIDRIIEKEREFWQYVETMSPPPNIVAEIVGEQIVVVGSVTKRTDEEFVAALTHLREARAVAKTGEELVEAAKANVLELVGDKPGIYESPGIGRVNYAMRAGRVTFDAEKLANVKPLDRLAVGAILQPYMSDLPESVIQKIGEANLDLTQFQKVGKPFPDFRFFGSREE